MKNYHDIIIQPVITERSTMLAAEGKYTFKVDTAATKTEIRQACEQLFNVRVLKVNTQNMPGKAKRVGVNAGHTPAWKKAIVTIDRSPNAASYLGKGGKKIESTQKYNDTIEEFGFGQ